MVLKDKFSASQFWQDCRKHDVTIINYIGEVCRYLVSRPKVIMIYAYEVIRKEFDNLYNLWRQLCHNYLPPF